MVCEADLKPLFGSTVERVRKEESMTGDERILMQALMNEARKVRRGPL